MPVNSQKKTNSKKKKGPSRIPKPVRKFVEFKGVNRLSLSHYQKKVRRLYDGPAGAVLAFGSMISLHEPLIGQMFRKKKFDVTSVKSILDVGSGAGQILKHLLKFTPSETRVVGLDLSHGMLKRARNRMSSDRACYITADMTNMPFADSSFDCVTCGWVIEHLPDPRPGLSEVGRVLKPGGSALILTTEDTFSGALVSRTWKCRTYNRHELQEACEEVGLPWKEELWLTRLHRFFKMGGILVEAEKPNDHCS